jgi:hypothetical protein
MVCLTKPNSPAKTTCRSGSPFYGKWLNSGGIFVYAEAKSIPAEFASRVQKIGIHIPALCKPHTGFSQCHHPTYGEINESSLLKRKFTKADEKLQKKFNRIEVWPWEFLNYCCGKI